MPLCDDHFFKLWRETGSASDGVTRADGGHETFAVRSAIRVSGLRARYASRRPSRRQQGRPGPLPPTGQKGTVVLPGFDGSVVQAVGFPAAIRACIEYLDGLGMTLVCVAERHDHWARRRASWERWPDGESERLIDCLDHMAPSEFPARLAAEPDAVPLLFFSGSCNAGIRQRSWRSVVLAEAPLRGRLVATTWAAWHLVGGGYGPLDLWAWQDGAPTQPVLRWSSKGKPVPIEPGESYQPPFKRMTLDRLFARPGT